MGYTLTGALTLALMFACLTTAAAQPLRLYVSPQGDDAWSGRMSQPNATRTDGPFATLERARDEIRARKRAGPLTERVMVVALAGEYYLERPLVLTAEDSGTAHAPIVYRSWQRGKARLVGGKALTGFRRYRGEIMRLDLKPLGLTQSPGQLFFGGQRQPLARWPNLDRDDPHGGEWSYIAGAPEADSRNRFHYADDRPDRWLHPEDAQVSIWPHYNWWHTIAAVADLDRERRIITLDQALPYEIKPGRRFFYQNVFEELDAPGEWFFDQRSGVLYFWPPAPIGSAEVVIPTLDGIVQLNEVQHVSLRGFTIEACRGDAVTVSGGSDCLIAACTVRNTGGWGIVIAGGTANGAIGNDIYATGRGGIVLGGGERAALAPAGNFADNNHIHHFAQIYRTYNTAVNISGVGSRISHNLIHDAPHIGLLLNGNEHIIEYNDLHHVCMEGGDNGGFYMGRDWTQRGNILRFNAFHDIYGFGLAGEPGADGVCHYDSPLWAWGVYLDDCSSGTTVYGNLFYRVPLCGVMVGGGRDNLVENNVFVECIPAYHVDARWDAYPWDLMQERLEAMNYRQPPYSERYPELLTMGDDPRTPANNRFLRNIVTYRRDDFRGLSSTRPAPESAILYNLSPFDPDTCVHDYNTVHHFGQPIRITATFYRKRALRDGDSWTWQAWQAFGFDRNSIVADPLFVDPDNDDYRLRPESPAYALGFKPLPVEKIGLYRSALRASWPPPTDTRREGTEWTRRTVRIGATR